MAQQTDAEERRSSAEIKGILMQSFHPNQNVKRDYTGHVDRPSPEVLPDGHNY
jgi:hypothetical protein